jgi:AcrR family transcriptional regulator
MSLHPQRSSTPAPDTGDSAANAVSPPSHDTRQVFANALRKLAKEQPLEKITVSQICARAGISRKTFYGHFHDKSSLINWICYTEFFDNHTKLMVDGGWKAAKAMAYYFEKDRELYGHALNDMEPGSFGSYFLAVLEVVIMNTTRESVKGIATDEHILAFMVETVAETIRCLFITWLTSPQKRSMDELFLLLRKGAELFAAIVCSVPLSRNGLGPCALAQYPLRINRAAAQMELQRTFDAFRE